MQLGDFPPKAAHYPLPMGCLAQTSVRVLTRHFMHATFRVMRPPNRIDELARASRMTFLQVAQACDVTERTVHRWKRGDVQIPEEQVARLADLFGVSEPWLLGEEINGHNGNGSEVAA